MNYLNWGEKVLTDFSSAAIEAAYNDGFVFTRIGKGIMHKTRSVRIDLSQFSPSSENRRILKKTEGLSLESVALPLQNYDWGVGKLAKDFYEAKFGSGIMSAAKIKEMLTDAAKSNFNSLLSYSWKGRVVGYTIASVTDNTIHYSYPFYDLTEAPKDMGMGMMLQAILYAQKIGKKYIYLGSLQRENDTYKLQFSGLEWYDAEKWNADIRELSTVLSNRA